MSFVAHHEPHLWAEQHFSGAEMSDVRRSDRIVAIAEAMAATPGGSIPTLFAHPYDIKAAYNLFKHPAATPDNVQAGHRELVLSEMQPPGVSLLLEETTELSFSGRKPVPGLGGLRLQPPPKAAAAPPWKSSGCATSSSLCGSLVPQAHHENPPRRESTGSGNRRNGSTPASGLAPPLKGYAGSGSVIVRRTAMNICAVATRSAMGSAFVRPKIGPDAIHRPASVPDAYLRWYAGLAPSTNLSWSCGRGLINQRGEPPSSSAPQRSRAVPRGALARA